MNKRQSGPGHQGALQEKKRGSDGLPRRLLIEFPGSSQCSSRGIGIYPAWEFCIVTPRQKKGGKGGGFVPTLLPGSPRCRKAAACRTGTHDPDLGPPCKGQVRRVIPLTAAASSFAQCHPPKEIGPTPRRSSQNEEETWGFFFGRRHVQRGILCYVVGGGEGRTYMYIHTSPAHRSIAHRKGRRGEWGKSAGEVGGLTVGAVPTRCPSWLP